MAGYDIPQLSEHFQRSNRAHAIRLAHFHGKKVLDIILFSEMQSPAIKVALGLTNLQNLWEGQINA